MNPLLALAGAAVLLTMSARKRARPKSRVLQDDTTPPEGDAPRPPIETEEEDDGSFKCESGFYNGYCITVSHFLLSPGGGYNIDIQNRAGEYALFDERNPGTPILQTERKHASNKGAWELAGYPSRDIAIYNAYEFIDGWTIK